MASGLLLGLVAVLLASTPRIGTRPGNLPPVVFVSRQPLTDAPHGIPGFGPHHRAAAPGGRLLVRERNGKLRPLVPPSRFHDVSDPDVSWDGSRVVFAATSSPDSAWRLWVVSSDGTGLSAVTHTDRSLDTPDLESVRFARYDDLDPCWLPDGRICFSTTRFPQRAQFTDLQATNLYVVNADGTGLHRITSERNGADEPTIDPKSGRVVYGRWLFNRYLASDAVPVGATVERAFAVPQDTINLWQAVSVLTDGDGIRLAGGDPRTHADLAAYEPILLGDGSCVGVEALQPALSPGPGGVRLRRFAPAVGPGSRLTGPGTRFPGAACSPAPLSNGKLLFSGDPTGSGDYGLYALRTDGRDPVLVVDLAGTLELDAAVLAHRPVPPIVAGECEVGAPELPLTRVRQLADSSHTFRFDCLNVFANGPVDGPIPTAPLLAQDLRIRFYGVLARPQSAGGDTLVLVREEPVSPSGAVHVDDIRADTPLFEQLVDAEGHVVRAARGPAHVPGYNFARLGSGTKCVGCHTGHSALEVPKNYWSGKWFNAAPSAEVWVSSLGGGSAKALVDRRTRGPAGEVAWVAATADGEVVRLQWKTTVEVSRLVLYALASESKAGTNVRVLQTEIHFFRDGKPVKRLRVRETLSPQGTRVDCEPVRVDAVEVRPIRVTGRVERRSAVALAEIETIARLVED